jgi:tetratricopeptide (TPR) repeat protein
VALTQLGKAADALKLAQRARPEFTRTPALQVRLQLAEAALHQYHFKDVAAAGKIYKTIFDEHSRVEHPNVRLAAVRWGDLFAETGDLVRASETYRVAATLGGEKFAGGGTSDASTRGALLRIAEQKLREGDIHATRQLLERLEMDFPGRRLDGLYCFLRAESARHAGRYDEALRHYEMIFNLPQWAGYRDRASYGMAETYFRQGAFDKSLKRLTDLRDGESKWFESQKGADFEKLVAGRLGRLKEARAAGDESAAFFKGFRTGFEPDEREWFGEIKEDYAAVRAPSVEGPHALLMDCLTREVPSFTYTRPFKNLTPGATYMVEIWYRDLARVSPPPPSAQAFLQVNLVGTAAPKPSVTASVSLLARASHHQWHKASVKIKAPPAQDCDLVINFYYLKGAYLFDHLSVRPVSDRQLEALTTFQEGPKAP